MNTSTYMDKQIMDLSNSHMNSSSNNSSDFFTDLMDPSDDHHHHHVGAGTIKKEEIVPSYDFQPIRPVVGASSSPPPPSSIDGVGVSSRGWNSADSKTNSPSIRNYGSLDSVEPAKVILEKDHAAADSVLVAEVDRTMKKYADNLLHALDGVSARLTQLETRTRNLEHSVDDLKVSVGNNHGSTDGKMRQLENILREVQAGVQVVRDKQEIMDAQLQLAKFQVSKGDQQAEAHKTGHIESSQPPSSVPLQSLQQFPSVAHTAPPPSLPPPNAPPPPSQQNLSPPAQLQQNLQPQVQLPNQYPPNQIPPIPQRESYFPPPGQTQENPNQQYQMPPPQQLQPSPPPPPQQQYQPPPQPQYSQPPPPPPQQHPSSVGPSQPQPPLGHLPEETSYMPSQNYPPGVHQPPSHPPAGVALPQQFYGSPQNMYEPPSSRPGPAFPGTYGLSSGAGEPYSYSSSPSQYGSGSPRKSQHLSSAGMGQSGGTGYPQLPTARILPHAVPTASSVSSGSAPAGAGNRVPIDDVVDKVTSMGFSREQVRATVRKLTENGQSVDLNVVLDKLMNDADVQPPRGWFGR